MQPVRTDACNAVFVAPADWHVEIDGECVDLPIHADITLGVMHSYWQPSEEDIANILAGLPIRLTVFGRSHPPVAIAVSIGTEH
jgi:hypothetical protein